MRTGWLIAGAMVVTLLSGSCAREPGSGVEAVAAGGTGEAGGSARELNVYNWFDYIDPAVIPEFEHEYGIHVNYDVYDTQEIVETKMLAGRTGYDVVVTATQFFEHQLAAGALRKLDRARLTNLGNEDPEAATFLRSFDPNNEYALIYTWLSTTGIAYDRVRRGDSHVSRQGSAERAARRSRRGRKGAALDSALPEVCGYRPLHVGPRKWRPVRGGRLLRESLRTDPAIYPPAQVRARLHADHARSQQATRTLMRLWTRFKTGR